MSGSPCRWPSPPHGWASRSGSRCRGRPTWGPHITPAGAWFVIVGIALLPGYLNIQMLAGVLLDRQLPLPPGPHPDLTVIVAAHREEARIAATLDHLAASR